MNHVYRFKYLPDPQDTPKNREKKFEVIHVAGNKTHDKYIWYLLLFMSNFTHIKAFIVM